MSNILWVSTHRHGSDITIVEHKDAFTQALPSLDKSTQPAFAVFVGKTMKSVALRAIFNAAGETIQHDPHGQVRLWSEPSSRSTAAPTIFVDCELHENRASQFSRARSHGPEAARHLQLSDDGTSMRDQKSLALRLYARVLKPIANLFCLFVSDLGGISGTQETLAQIAISCRGTDTPRVAICRVVIVVPTRSQKVQHSEVLARILDGAVRYLVKADHCQSETEARAQLYRAFADVTILALDDFDSREHRTQSLLQTIQQQLEIVREARLSSRRLFSLHHSVALMRVALERFSAGMNDTYSLIEASRAHLEPSSGLPLHITEFLTQAGSQRDISHTVVPLLASAFVLNSCPPGMHCKATPLCSKLELIKV